MKNDIIQSKILSNERNKISIAMIELFDKTIFVLKQFESNFEFNVAKFKNDRVYDRNVNYDSDLTYVMK